MKNSDPVPFGDIPLDNSITMKKSDPGPMIEKKYGNNVGDRYGIGQFKRGTMRMYAADAFGPATVNMSFAKADGEYTDALKIDRAGKMNVMKGGKICINDTCIDEDTLKSLTRLTKK
jgi:hypothetical protein